METHVSFADQYYEDQLQPFMQGAGGIAALAGTTPGEFHKSLAAGIRAFKRDLFWQADALLIVAETLEPTMYLCTLYRAMVAQQLGHHERALTHLLRTAEVLEFGGLAPAEEQQLIIEISLLYAASEAEVNRTMALADPDSADRTDSETRSSEETSRRQS